MHLTNRCSNGAVHLSRSYLSRSYCTVLHFLYLRTQRTYSNCVLLNFACCPLISARNHFLSNLFCTRSHVSLLHPSKVEIFEPNSVRRSVNLASAGRFPGNSYPSLTPLVTEQLFKTNFPFSPLNSFWFFSSSAISLQKGQLCCCTALIL